ncbi:hypothetical protein DM02DRAFT_728607 [Periconia macrospinosa]|uniref:Uncharacterized protein n=1 Tax=Periconia macrospinosa TaxID=97972 RepID=A0A2V1DT22_9PLEO|nr:hypothetical protein DM02DRAFT_728607 [Periconia macrospinosa]
MSTAVYSLFYIPVLRNLKIGVLSERQRSSNSNSNTAASAANGNNNNIDETDSQFGSVSSSEPSTRGIRSTVASSTGETNAFAVTWPPAPPPSTPTTQQIVNRLMNPPQAARTYNKDHTPVTLSMIWVVNFVGVEHFQTSTTSGRHVLRPNDPLAVQGADLGLSSEILTWLKEGDDNNITLPTSHFQ